MKTGYTSSLCCTDFITFDSGGKTGEEASTHWAFCKLVSSSVDANDLQLAFVLGCLIASDTEDQGQDSARYGDLISTAAWLGIVVSVFVLVAEGQPPLCAKIASYF